MNSFENIDILLARHFAGESLDEAQERELADYIRLNGKEYARLKAILESMDKKVQEPVFDMEAAWQNVEGRLNGGKYAEIRAVRVFMAVAAILLLLLGVGIYAYRSFFDSPTFYYANNRGRLQKVELPDHSTVTLYPNSAIEFEKDVQGNGERNVRLTGKGYFDVKNDGTAFVVSAVNLKVEVLGTAFTVDVLQKENESVAVERGKVRVSGGGQQTILTKDQSVEWTEGKLVRTDHKEKTLSRKKMLVYRNEQLRTVISELEKQLGVKIELGKGIAENSVTTKINPEHLGAVLKELSYLCGCQCDTLGPRHYRLHY